MTGFLNLKRGWLAHAGSTHHSPLVLVLPRSVLLRRRPRPLSSTMLRARDVLQRELVQNGFAPFTSLHPVLDATCAPIAGPFEDAAICKKACNAWSHDAGKQPRGTFRVRTDGTYAANMHRGPRFKIRCSNSRSDKLGELGKRSRDACQDVLDGVNELFERLHRKHSVHADKNDAGVIDPTQG